MFGRIEAGGRTVTALALVERGTPPPRSGPGTAVRSHRPGTTAPGLRSADPVRPLHPPEQERRCRQVRPTRAPTGAAHRTIRHNAAVRRRRVLLGTVATGLIVALALPWSGAGGHPLATPGAALAGDRVAAHGVYVVQPGDTLWSIAERLAPNGDPRPVVAQLEARVGGDTVVPGERISIP